MLDPGHSITDAQPCRAGVTSLSPGQNSSGTHIMPAGATLAGGQGTYATHGEAAPGSTFPTAVLRTEPTVPSPSGTNLPPTINPTTPTPRSSAASISDPGHSVADTQSYDAGADLHDALLAVLADALDDLERVRIATQNRVRALRQVKGLEGTKFEANLTELTDALAAMEHKATLDLQRAMRLHPLGAHVKATKGLGEKQAARLLAAIGNPADRATPAKLWQYAGHGDPARSRKRRGQVVEFNPTAKMRVHLCAESAMKQRCGACTVAAKAMVDATPHDGAPWQPPHDCTCAATHPYRAVYDRERAKWADRETSDGHKHNHALRVVGKHILLDLWKAARKEAA